VSADDDLLQLANELIRRDVVHEINDACGFDVSTLSDDSVNLFRFIDDENPIYFKKRSTLASFISPRYSAAAAGGFVVVSDFQAKLFTGTARTWRQVNAVLSVLAVQPIHDASFEQISFGSMVLFEHEFSAPTVNMMVTGGQDKVLKIVSLRYGAPVLGFQSFNGFPGEMSELEVFLEFSSEEIQNEWLLLLCQIGVVPELESPSQDSGFSFRQEISSGSAMLLMYAFFLICCCFGMVAVLMMVYHFIFKSNPSKVLGRPQHQCFSHKFRQSVHRPDILFRDSWRHWPKVLHAFCRISCRQPHA
jgi:hypothetical protein